jgi:uncharacterized membrane protein YwaF
MGPWPWYLLSLEVVALTTFVLFYLPWHFVSPGEKGKALAADH